MAETNTGKYCQAVPLDAATDTLVWSMVILRRFVHVPPVLYQDPLAPLLLVRVKLAAVEAPDTLAMTE